MLTGYFMSLLWCGLFYFAGGLFGLLLFLGQALFAKFILEIVNYMEHYGLKRLPAVPIGFEHSWNTNKRMSGMVLFSLTRHSAHHEKPKVKFWKLDPHTQRSTDALWVSDHSFYMSYPAAMVSHYHSQSK
jgi:alkane 1-monooxygenase